MIILLINALNRYLMIASGLRIIMIIWSPGLLMPATAMVITSVMMITMMMFVAVTVI
jgi:hypothetical protein